MCLHGLAGCSVGDVASPSNYMSDMDTTTTETTTTEVQTAEQTLSNTRNVCIGLRQLGSCNTTQSNTQGTGLPKPSAQDRNR